MNKESFANYLGVDYKREGSLVKIICPFHNDTHPSMVLYDDHAYCYACGQGASLPWLASQIKGISYPQALEELGMEVLPVGERRVNPIPAHQPMSFCERPTVKFAKAFKEKHDKCYSYDWCKEHYGDNRYAKAMVDFVVGKHLDEQMPKLDWRLHDGTVFKHWGVGIVIPYMIGQNIVYERVREYDEANKKFSKPKGPYDVSIQPYFSTFIPNNTVFIVEGESDAASVFAHGCSAIGIPGAAARKAINTVVAFIADRDYIETIVCCGDNDQSGQRMNQLIREAVIEMCPRKQLLTYTVESIGDKSDLNDDHCNKLFKPSVKWTAVYGDNYNRQPYADADFAEFVDKFDDDFVEGYTNGSGITVYKRKENVLANDAEPSPVNLPQVEINEPIYHNRSVSIAKYKIASSPNHFYLTIKSGALAGKYEMRPDKGERGWDEVLKSKKGYPPIPVRCFHLDDFVKIS